MCRKNSTCLVSRGAHTLLRNVTGGVHLTCKTSGTVGPKLGGGLHLACKVSGTVGPELGLCDRKQNEASSVWVDRGYIYTTLGCPFLRIYLWGSLYLVFTHMPGGCYRSLLGSVVVALAMCVMSAECHQFLYDARPNLLISSSFFFFFLSFF